MARVVSVVFLTRCCSSKGCCAYREGAQTHVAASIRRPTSGTDISIGELVLTFLSGHYRCRKNVGQGIAPGLSVSLHCARLAAYSGGPRLRE